MIFFVDLLLLALAASWLTYHLLHQDASLGLGWAWLTLPLVALVAVGALSVLWSAAPFVSAENSLRALLALILYLFLVNHGLSGRAAAAALAAGSGLQALIAFGQFVVQGPLGLPFGSSSSSRLAIRPRYLLVRR